MKCFVLAIFAVFVSACCGSSSDRLLLNQIQKQVILAQQTDRTLKLNQINHNVWDELVLLKPYTELESFGEEWSADKSVMATKIDRRDDITVLVFIEAEKVVNVVEFPRADFDFSKLEVHRYRPEDHITLSSF